MTITSDALLAQFRLDVDDNEQPYLWSDAEVLSYIDSSQKWFCRKVEGIGDASSTLTQISVNVGDEWKPISPLILRFRDAYALSDGCPVAIINYEDLVARRVRFDGRTGPVRTIVIGMEPGRVRLNPIAAIADTIQLLVDRLPLKAITDIGQNLEVQDQHFDGLMYWVKHMAYSKQDAQVMDKNASEEYKAKFMEYAHDALVEKQRAKHKTRVVAYGGVGDSHGHRLGYGSGYGGNNYGQ